MGYEAEVPPVPDRNAEKELINQIKNSFQKQPFYKYYMPEAPRLSKMYYKELTANYSATWAVNFLKGVTLSSIVALSFPVFFKKMTSGVPFYQTPKMIQTSSTIWGYNIRSNYKAMLRQVPFVLIFSTLYAYRYTQSIKYDDEVNYRYLLPK